MPECHCQRQEPMSAPMFHKIELVAQDSGDPSVGIWPYFQEITIEFKHGELEENKADIEQALCDALREILCECDGSVITKAEHEEDLKAQKAFDEQDSHIPMEDIEI